MSDKNNKRDGLIRFNRILLLLLLILIFIYAQVPARAQNSGSKLISAIPTMDELAGTWQNASELLAMPAINNTQGAAEAQYGVLSIGNLSFPPITMTGGTGSLLINDKKPELTRARWYPYQVLRKGVAGKIGIETAVRMPYKQKGLFFHIVLKNDGTKPQSFNLKINLTANTSQHKHWGWKVPRPREPGRFKAMATDNNRSLLLHDSMGKLGNCFSFEKKSYKISAKGDSGQAEWNIILRPGETRVINYVLAIGKKDEAVHKMALQWASRFPYEFEKVKKDWQTRFDAMFTPHNKFFSGYLPVLKTSDSKMRRMYYMSLISVLSEMRTSFPVAPRVYVSDSPQSNCTMMYFWDTSEWANTLALLDPVMLKKYLESWLSKGIYNGYAEEYLTGTLQGPWYSANDLSVFRLLNAYLNITGDQSFLTEKINGKTVLEYMDDIATHWKSLVKPGRELADYGGAKNLLECVPTYINEVASFNAANVRMMRQVAEIQEKMGNKAQAERLRMYANKLVKSVLKMYVPGEGFWVAIHRNGARVPIRHVFDFATIGLTIKSDLTPEIRNQMIDFVKRELLTEHWMRAQSLSDIAASVSNRPDHGPMGAYCAWPGETLAVMCEFDKFKLALNFLHRCTYVTYEGPFSQSRELMSKKRDAAVHISPAPQTYNASNGGSFAETIIREFFGFKPDFLKHTLIPDSKNRYFKGVLLNVRQGNKVYDIHSTNDGLKINSVK